MSATSSLKSRPDLATSEGLVVTPSRSPVWDSSSISLKSPVSTKNFISQTSPKSLCWLLSRPIVARRKVLFSASADRREEPVGELVDPIFGNAGDVDAAVVDHVDAVLRLELGHDVLGQTEQREHARMLGDEVEIGRIRTLLDGRCKFDAQALHAFP